MFYQDQSDNAKAELFYKRALSVWEKALAPSSTQLGMRPLMANTLHNLARLYHIQGDYTKAEPLYKRALSITEKAVGTSTPAAIVYRKNLVLLYRVTSREKEALELEQRPERIRSKR